MPDVSEEQLKHVLRNRDRSAPTNNAEREIVRLGLTFDAVRLALTKRTAELLGEVTTGMWQGIRMRFIIHDVEYTAIVSHHAGNAESVAILKVEAVR